MMLRYQSLREDLPVNTYYPHPPYQQAAPRKPKRSRAVVIGWLVLGGLAALAVVLSTVNSTPGGPSGNAPAAAPVVVSTSTPTPTVTTEVPESAATSEPIPIVPTETEASPVRPSMTTSQEQAVGAAESYLNYKAFSRKGLIHQLSSEYGEGFSTADATFAVDHITVDWNEQAAKSAQDYLAFQHFSRAGLIHQLESEYGEQFTHEQAVYGVTKVGL